MYDWLLFLHVLAAFMLAVTVVSFSALALGLVTTPGALRVSNLLWDVGGLGTLVLGVWLAIYVDDYEVWDGWILGAIVLWVVATGTGQQVRKEVGEGSLLEGRALRLHWLRALVFVAILALMIWKPGA
jgi:hypothetical protein